MRTANSISSWCSWIWVRLYNVITKTDSSCLQVSGIVKEYGRFEYSGQLFTKKNNITFWNLFSNLQFLYSPSRVHTRDWIKKCRTSRTSFTNSTAYIKTWVIWICNNKIVQYTLGSLASLARFINLRRCHFKQVPWAACSWFGGWRLVFCTYFLLNLRTIWVLTMLLRS